MFAEIRAQLEPTTREAMYRKQVRMHPEDFRDIADRCRPANLPPGPFLRRGIVGIISGAYVLADEQMERGTYQIEDFTRV